MLLKCLSTLLKPPPKVTPTKAQANCVSVKLFYIANNLIPRPPFPLILCLCHLQSTRLQQIHSKPLRLLNLQHRPNKPFPCGQNPGSECEEGDYADGYDGVVQGLRGHGVGCWEAEDYGYEAAEFSISLAKISIRSSKRGVKMGKEETLTSTRLQ
jgi:hypothetical protein